jgi:sugar phosphate isomerase/epimerase
MSSKRPLSLAALTVLGLSADEHIICAEKTGYQGVGLRLIPATPNEPFYSVLDNTLRRNKVKELIRSTGIQVIDIEVFRLTPETHVPDFLPFIEFGVELGAKNMLVAGYDPDWSRMTEHWIELTEISKPFGIKPHIEPMPWTNVKSYLDGLKLVRSNHNGWGAVLIDPIHFFRTGGDFNQIHQEDISFAGYIQLSDAALQIPLEVSEILRQAREDRLVPGMGELPLKELLSFFPTDLPISLEVPLDNRWGCHSQTEKAAFVIKNTLHFLDQIN